MGVFCHGKFGSLSPRKASCDRVALPNLNSFLASLMYAVFLCGHTTGSASEAYSFTTDGNIFNVRTHFTKCRVRTREGGRGDGGGGWGGEEGGSGGGWGGGEGGGGRHK